MLAEVQAQSPAVATSSPSMLFIPKINVNAQVTGVGVTSAGLMDTPKNLEEVGWYDRGPVPGAVGNAVIAGHLDDLNGDPLVFARLSELEKGDSIYVLNESYELLHFEVTSSVIYAYDATNTVAIFGPADASQLNVITCEGEWLSDARKGYTERLVVFSKRVFDK